MKEIKVKSLPELLTDAPHDSGEPWNVRAIIHEDCISYLVWNERNREALLVDPKLECTQAIQDFARELRGYLWIAALDTHTHADHVSCAWTFAESLACPLVMHAASGTTRVHLRVSQETTLPTRSGPIELIMTPGHTPDGLTAVWGPFAFTGDTVFIDDVGRDDLPGGDPVAHYSSLQRLRARLSPQTVILPGHDCRGGRAAVWQSQLKTNASLTQRERDFVSEASAFQAPAPKDFKRALFENLK